MLGPRRARWASARLRMRRLSGQSRGSAGTERASMVKTGRHFLQIPGPTNVPDRVLRAIDQPTIDHRSREASDLALACINGMRRVFQTKGGVLIFPGSGTGAWESALVNTLSPGDRVLA